MSDKKKIMVAEDSTMILNLITKILTRHNYEVIPAKDGKEVMEKIDKEKVELLLLDLYMPHLSGEECASMIRAMKDKKKAGIPIIAITGNYGKYKMEDFKSLGFDMYLTKPLDYDQVLNIVNSYLK